MLDHVHLRKLDVSKCALSDSALSKLWIGLAGQGLSLQHLDLSKNQGVVRFDIVQDTLRRMRRLTSLNIAGNTRIVNDESLLDPYVMEHWMLQDIDLSGIMVSHNIRITWPAVLLTLRLQLNDATVDALADYLETGASKSLQTLKLNNCGITGRQIARLLSAMGKARQLALYINASRLDDGIDEFCELLACGYGPWCLFAQMIEFAQEANYIKLLDALTLNESVECLSLAGTSTPDNASAAACQAIAAFFQKNRTVRYLDISGFDSKLDEGRLGREFSKALLELRKNEHIEHIRVRSQMLNINIGDLAEAISENQTMHTLDCEGNDFNLSNFKHLVSGLKDNTCIRYFSAFSKQDLDSAIHKSLETAIPPVPQRKTSVMSRFKHDKTPKNTERPLTQRLRDEWDITVDEAHRCTERNRTLADERDAGQVESEDDMTHSRYDAERLFSGAFGGLALEDFRRRRSRSNRSSQESEQPPTPDSGVQGHAHSDSQGSRDLSLRPFSTVSSDVALTPVADDSGSDSGGFTPLGLEFAAVNHFDVMFATSDGAMTANGDMREPAYTFTDGYDMDDGLQMKRYRRYVGDPTSRIDEEDASFSSDSGA